MMATDVAATEPEVAAEEAAAAAPETTATAGDSKPAKEAKAKKAAAPRKARSTATHPPYAEVSFDSLLLFAVCSVAGSDVVVGRCSCR